MTDATEIARYLVEDLRLTIGRRRSAEEMTDVIEADIAFRDGAEE